MWIWPFYWRVERLTTVLTYALIFMNKCTLGWLIIDVIRYLSQTAKKWVRIIYPKYLKRVATIHTSRILILGGCS